MSKCNVLRDRTIQEAQVLLYLDSCGSSKATIRGLVEVLNLMDGKAASKSTIHKDLTERLPKYNEPLAAKVRVILDKNYKERAARGGAATKRLFKGTTKRTDIKKLNINPVD